MKSCLLITLAFAALIQASLGAWKHESFPGRVSGKSFLPDKSFNYELLKTKSDMFTFRMGGRKADVAHRRMNPQASLDLCKGCVEFANEALQNLLNAILNVGVVGSCGKLCNYVEEKTGSKFVGVACNLFCDYEGITEFVKLIEQADLDPIYYCELLKQCKINDSGDAKITDLKVNPVQGPQGTEFAVDVEYVSVNGTGTGELYIGVKTIDGIPLEDSFLIVAQPAGKYSTRITVKAEPDPDCDPTQVIIKTQ